MRNIIIVAFVGVALMFSSCGKYEEGPALSLRTKKARIAGIWKYDKILDNGVEQTLDAGDLLEEFEVTKDGKYQRRAANVIIEKGSWNFGDKKETIEITPEGSPLKIVFTILRLTNKEFWCSFTFGNDVDEFHYVKVD